MILSIFWYIIAVVQLAIGTFFLAIVVSGFFKSNLNKLERAALFIASLCLIAPEMISSIIGAVLGIAILVLSAAKIKKNAAAA